MRELHAWDGHGDLYRHARDAFTDALMLRARRQSAGRQDSD